MEDVVAMPVKDIGKQFRQVSDLLTHWGWVSKLNVYLQAFMVEETKRDIFVKVAGIENKVESKLGYGLGIAALVT